MLNYVSAEFYKLTRKKGLLVGAGILMVLESLLFLPGVLVKEELSNITDAYLAFLMLALGLGLLLAPVFAARSFDDQYGNGTLKNEIVCGIPRSRIYLGKLLAGMLAGTLSALAVIGWYLLLTLLLTRPYLPELSLGAAWWGSLWRAVGRAWLSWLSALSFAFFLMMLLKSSTAAMAVCYLVTVLGTPVALVGGAEPSNPLWFSVLCRLFYGCSCFYDMELLSGELESTVIGNWGYALGSWGIWTVGLTALGVLLFQRREIK